MQPTEKLFYTAPTARTMQTTVLAAEQNRVALAATVFYPEGGGQPADGGVLRFEGHTAVVTDVHEKDGVVWHTLAAEGPLPQPGQAVEGEIDWARRFDHMQQHTGEHILSGTLHRLFGAENVGFHIGVDAVRMDMNIPLTAEQLWLAETEANRCIWQDVALRIWWPEPAELAALTYRSKKELTGAVRIVEVPGADVCACCGTHVETTGQVGCVKILSSENYKGGVRLAVVCGGRALEAFQGMRQRQAEIGALLSAKSEQTAEAVRRVYGEYNALKFSYLNLSYQLFDALAGQAAATPQAPAVYAVPGLDPDGLHRLAVRLAEKTTGLCAALTENEKGVGYCLAAATGDVRPLTRELNTAFAGRGGGKPNCCQGSCTAGSVEEIRAFLLGKA